MVKTGQWVNNPDDKRLHGTLNTGDRWFIPFGSAEELPKPAEGYYWEFDSENITGRFYRFLEKRDKIPNLREENDKLQMALTDAQREFNKLREQNALGREQNQKLQTAADEWREKYHKERQDKATITDAFDKRGAELEDYKERVEIAVGSLAESSHRLDEVHQKNTSLVYDNKCLREELSSLQRALVEPSDECTVAEQSPEAKAYEDIHTKRMAAEIRSIELDNLKKENELKFGEEYPHSIWYNLQTRIKDNENATKTIALWGSFTGTAILINEVAQWVNL